MGIPLLCLLIFTAVTLSLVAGYQLLTGVLSRNARQARERLEKELRKDLPVQDPQNVLFKNPEQLTLEAPSASLNLARKETLAVRMGTDVRSRLTTLLEQSDVPLTLVHLLALSGGLGLALGVAGLLLRGPLLGIAGAAAGAAAPLLYVNYRRNTRREKLLTQLPNAFGLMARVLRAGYSVPQSLQAVADAFDGPLGAEFERCQKQQSLGIRPEVTFHEMAQRTGILEVRIFVTSMLIQQQTGGNLSEMLERLAALIRDRTRIRRQVRTLTAEGRLQGLTLLILPVLVFGALLIVNRKYAQVLLDHPSLLAATGTAMGVGVLWIRRIVNFDF